MNNFQKIKLTNNIVVDNNDYKYPEKDVINYFVHYEQDMHGIRISKNKQTKNEIEIGWYATNDTVQNAQKFLKLFEQALEFVRENDLY